MKVRLGCKCLHRRGGGRRKRSIAGIEVGEIGVGSVGGEGISIYRVLMNAL